MRPMLQQEVRDERVVATGRATSVRRMCRIAFEHVDPDAKKRIEIGPQLYRPAEVRLLLGNPAQAKAKLGWKATTGLGTLIAMRIDADMERAARR